MCWLDVRFWSTRPTYWLVFPPEAAALLKLLVSTFGFVGNGMYLSSTKAAWLISPAGIVFPANCVRPQPAAEGVATQAALTLSGS